MMTSRERWLALMAGDRPDRVPCDYAGTEEVTRRLLAELGCATERELWERWGIDKCIHLGPTHPLAKVDAWHFESVYSVWHIGTVTASYGDGLGTYDEAVIHPLAEAGTVGDVERFEWPDPEVWDVTGLRTKCAEWRNYPILGGCYEPFYLYRELRGMEQALADLILQPEMVEAAMERIYYIHESIIRRTLEEAAGMIDFIYVAEDLGTQESLLVNPGAFRHYLKPWMRRMIDLAHSFGAKVIHHDDGAIRPLLPELIEIGIDILNPVQWRCRGMDREGLARDFGKSLVFHGGVDNQQTLPFGTPGDVRREVAENIRIFRSCKGHIVAPCHNIQPNTPTENILALYEAVEEFG
ncbi:MAG: uroporphyrinogen decarboxylase family protein [Terriglobia bacterium]|jgi:uroporphyrinogen decarboxylase